MRLAVRFGVLLTLTAAALFAVGCFGGKGGGGGGENGGGNGGGGGGQNPPNLSITVAHQGNFTQGQQNATYTVIVSNAAGAGATQTQVMVQEGHIGSGGCEGCLPPGLTLVSIAGAGWACTVGTMGCTRSDALAGGSSFPPITVTVNVATDATSPIVNVVSACCTEGGGTSVSASDSTTIMSSGGTNVTVATSVPFPIFAGDPATAIAITVANDVAGDSLMATFNGDANTGLPCTPATCGTLGSVTGTSGSGSYTLSYTPPPSAGFTMQTLPQITVSSSLPGSFAATDFIEVDPAGILVTIGGGHVNGVIQVGSGLRTVTATVYNDVTHQGVTFAPLTASGYACSNIGTNSCGTLGAQMAPVASGNATTTTITYIPPAASLPSAPYDRPQIQATSVADNTRFASGTFLLSSTAPTNTGLSIPLGNKFNSALASPGAVAITVNANIANDTGNSRTVNWTLTTSGATCSPTCGTLGTPAVTGNGASVSSAITYTPPSSFPTVAADLTPTITATSVDNPAATDNFTFTIADGTCGTGHESVLNGQYASLVRGGNATVGYVAQIGSFTTNGAGAITGGLLDINGSQGPSSGLTIAAAGSSYSVGADNRVCLTLADTVGDVLTYRAGVGTLVSGVATEGRMVRFNDNNGRRARLSGVLMKQDPASFNPGAFSGTYVDGFVGADFGGHRFASAGLVTSDGTSTLSVISTDYDSFTAAANLTGGSGSYTTATNAPSGRGTATITLPGLPTSHLVLYMVSSSEILGMTTDSLASNVIESGELKKQTGPFTATSLDNGGYVFYSSGIDPSNGGNNTVIGQSAFTTNGNAMLTVDDNDNGVEQTEQTGAAIFTIASNGRTTFSGAGAGTNPPILYLIDANSAFLVGTNSSIAFGFVEKQTGGPFSTASISGSFFFGGDAPTTGTAYDSGIATFDGLGGITGTDDSSGSNGLKQSALSPSNGDTYSFSATSIPPGQGAVGPKSIAYAISGSKIIFMSTGQEPELFIVQQ